MSSDPPATDTLMDGGAVSDVSLRRGQRVGPYVLLEPLGRGAHGVVFAGRDRILGRRVALKVIGHRTTDPGQRDRLLAEARIAARLDHPNIVTVFGVHEVHGAQVVAMELVRGQNLRARCLARGSMAPQEVARVGHQIAEGLRHAHAHGVLHRDLKPSNIAIALDGRLRILDFGTAIPTPTYTDTPLAGSPAGTIGYIAPERWAGVESPAGDAWSLGATLYWLACGELPFPTTDRIEHVAALARAEELPAGAIERLPLEIRAVVASLLVKDPEARPDLASVSESLARIAARASGATTRSPFPGLRSFGEDDAKVFFGRERAVEEVVERARRGGLLLIVGPSGSGKSSLAHAGAVPRLKESGEWVVLRCRPGADPVRSLATTVADGSGIGERADALRARPEELWANLADLAGDGRRALLVVDQLEEVVTLCDDSAARATFLDALMAASAGGEADPVRVIVTLRDDFLGRLVAETSRSVALSNIVVLGPPGRDELRAMIERPVASAGYAFDDEAVVDEMIEEVIASPASLPLLQFAARALWDARDDEERLLRREVYAAKGGVAGLLAAHADGALAGLDERDLNAARGLLLALVSADRTRRRVGREALLDGRPMVASVVLDRLVELRLVTTTLSEGVVMCELSHDSLLHTWSTLRGWVQGQEATHRALLEADAAATLWDGRGRDRSLLWRDEPLQRLREVFARPPFPPRAGTRAFFEASEAAAGRRRRVRNLAVGGAVGLGLAMLAASIAVTVGFKRLSDGEASARALAERREQAALEEGARSALEAGEPLRAAALAREILESGDSDAARGLWLRIRDQPLRWTLPLPGFGYEARFSPDEREVALGLQTPAVHVLDTRTGGHRLLRGHHGQVTALAYAQDGTLYSGGNDGEIRRWRGEDATVIGQHGRGVRELSIDSRGCALFSAGTGGVVRTWPIRACGEAREITVAPFFTELALRADLGWIVGGTRGGVVVLHGLDDGQRRELTRHSAAVESFAVDRDGRRLASASGHGTLHLTNLVTGDTRVLAGHTERVNALAFTPRGDVLASADATGRVQLWRTDTAMPWLRLWARHGVRDVAFARDGRELVTLGDAVQMWVVPQTEAAQPVHSTASFGLAFSDDEHLFSSGVDGRVIRWSLTTGRRESFLAHTRQIRRLASIDGTRFVSASSDRTVRAWNTHTGESRLLVASLPTEPQSLTAAPDGRVAVGGRDGTIWVYDAQGDALQTIAAEAGQVRDLLFEPGGTHLIATHYDGVVRRWRMSDGQLDGRVAQIDGPAMSVSLAPGGGRLAAAGFGPVHLVDIAAGQTRRVPVSEAFQYGVRFHPRAEPPVLAVASADHAVHILDFVGANRVLTGHTGEVNYVAFSDDGAFVAASGDDHSVRAWRYPSGRPVWYGAGTVGAAALTHRGWSSAPPDLSAELARDLAESASRVDGLDAVLCAVDASGTARLFRAGELSASASVAQPSTVRATPEGCAILSPSGLQMLVETGVEPQIEGVAAIDVSDGQLVSVQGTTVVRGAERRGPFEPSAVAVAATDRRSILGYADGTVQIHQLGAVVALRDTPVSPVRRVANGPRGSVLVGFGSGALGVWSASGERLAVYALHGAVEFLSVDGSSVRALTDLGDPRVVDLTPLAQDRCELLAELWREVPVGVRDGRVVAASAPPGHACAPSP